MPRPCPALRVGPEGPRGKRRLVPRGAHCLCSVAEGGAADGALDGDPFGAWPSLEGTRSPSGALFLPPFFGGRVPLLK